MFRACDSPGLSPIKRENSMKSGRNYRELYGIKRWRFTGGMGYKEIIERLDALGCE